MGADTKIINPAETARDVQFLASVILHLLNTQLSIPGVVPPSTYARLYVMAQTTARAHHDQ